MEFLLDTNICIYIIKRRPPEVLQKFCLYPAGALGVSSITVAELKYGAAKSQFVQKNQQALEKFLIPLEIIDFDYNASVIYGDIRATLETLGTPIGPLDMLIAAHALSQDVTLVTNNTKEFSRVPRLRITDWVS